MKYKIEFWASIVLAIVSVLGNNLFVAISFGLLAIGIQTMEAM